MASRKNPVMLVPGFSGQNFLYWNVMRRLLEGAGHPVYTMDVPRFGLVEIPAAADILAARVEDIRDVTGSPRVDLVGHSLGGLIARYYVSVLGGHEWIDHCVCIATPHHGTYAAYLILATPAGRQLIPGNEFLRRLNDAHRPNGVKYYNLYSATDPLLIPSSNAKLPHAKNRRILLGGHLGVLASPQVFHLVAEALEN
ncbi:MAG: lipase family alpha/beta hydrolase [Methanobacteriota archaeon]